MSSRRRNAVRAGSGAPGAGEARMSTGVPAFAGMTKLSGASAPESFVT